tara:strand:- start:14236 stop:15090 length:855 start_codon:yes stop_codon:yes gene_type:complete
VSNDARENNEVFSANQARAAGFQTRNVMADDFGFEIPVEAVPLPSNGRIYPVDSPLHNLETLEIRAMTAKEEDILTSRALIKKGTVITHLIKSCLVNKAIDVDAMTVGDRNAIMTALRVTGYGSEYTAEVQCPACGEQSKQDFQLTELPIKRLDSDPVAEGANLFEFKLPVTKKTVHFKFLTGADETNLTVMMERRKKQGGESENLVTTRLQHQIVAIEGIKDRNKINTFVRNMPARDSLALRKHIDGSEPGLDMKTWMDCPHCMETSEVRLPMGASFFWPDTE